MSASATGLIISPRLASAILSARRAAVAYCDARAVVDTLSSKRQTKAVKAALESAEVERAACKTRLESANRDLLRIVYGAFASASDELLEGIANG